MAQTAGRCSQVCCCSWHHFHISRCTCKLLFEVAKWHSRGLTSACEVLQQGRSACAPHAGLQHPHPRVGQCGQGSADRLSECGFACLCMARFALGQFLGLQSAQMLVAKPARSMKLLDSVTGPSSGTQHAGSTTSICNAPLAVHAQ